MYTVHLVEARAAYTSSATNTTVRRESTRIHPSLGQHKMFRHRVNTPLGKRLKKRSEKRMSCTRVVNTCKRPSLQHTRKLRKGRNVFNAEFLQLVIAYVNGRAVKYTANVKLPLRRIGVFEFVFQLWRVLMVCASGQGARRSWEDRRVEK